VNKFAGIALESMVFTTSVRDVTT